MDQMMDSAKKAELVAAAAEARGLKPSDFIGLQSGKSFLAFDTGTNTYWAGAQLVPNPKSYNAMVSSQDDGAYTIFSRKAGAAKWTVTNSGAAGPNSESGSYKCRVVPPADVLALWGWAPNTCHPEGIY